VPLSIGSTMANTADAIVDWRAAIAIAIAVVAALALLAWIGGELHYRNCLAKAELESPHGFAYATPNSKNPGSVGYLTPTRLAESTQATGDCTRVPF
jgi:hypothetical protein